MTTAGIDFDTHAVHVVFLLEDGEAIYKRYGLDGHDAFERTRSVRRAMPTKGVWEDMGVVACAIEEPQGVQKATVAKLKAVQGAILACLPGDLLVEPMVPARWRTTVGLSGHASKDEVAAFARARAGHPRPIGDTGFRASALPEQDACDAYCLALAVSTLWEKAA